MKKHLQLTGVFILWLEHGYKLNVVHETWNKWFESIHGILKTKQHVMLLILCQSHTLNSASIKYTNIHSTTPS